MFMSLEEEKRYINLDHIFLVYYLEFITSLLHAFFHDALFRLMHGFFPLPFLALTYGMCSCVPVVYLHF